MGDRRNHSLRKAREVRNLSQLQLAVETRLSSKTIWNAEHDKPISALLSTQLCEYFQMSSEN